MTTSATGLYTIVHPKGSTLYHGSKEPILSKYDSPGWYFIDKTNASNYGSVITTLITKRELNLVDIQNPFFQMDFTYKVQTAIPENTREKFLSLIPLGLPSLTSQQQLISEHPPICADSKSNLNVWASMFQNKHRYSKVVNGENIDNIMVSTLKSIYGDKIHGYISRFEWPSCMQDGGIFHAEVCIFNPKVNTLIKGSEQISETRRENDAPKVYKGGTRALTSQEYVIQENKRRLQRFESTGWTAPVLYDKRGFVRIPKQESVDNFRALSIRANASPEDRASTIKIRAKMGVLTPHVDEAYWKTVKYFKMV